MTTEQELITISESRNSWDGEQDAVLHFLKSGDMLSVPRKILVVGCCGDIFSEWLASLGHEVTGIDQRPYSLDQWEHNSPERTPNFNFIMHDFMTVDLPQDYFDLAIAISSIEHFGLGRWEDPIDADGDVKATRKVLMALHHGGLFIITVPYMGAQPPGTFSRVAGGNAHRGYSEEGIKRLLEGFTVVASSQPGSEIIIRATKGTP